MNLIFSQTVRDKRKLISILKARAEIDEVVGRSRLPTLEDRPNLPYFEALMAELTRRANVLPFAVFHSNEEDAHISGFR